MLSKTAQNKYDVAYNGTQNSDICVCNVHLEIYLGIWLMQLHKPCHSSVLQRQLYDTTHTHTHTQGEACWVVHIMHSQCPHQICSCLGYRLQMAYLLLPDQHFRKRSPRDISSNSALPEKCQLWLQGLPVETVCPRLAAPAPLTCAFACQPLLHTEPAPSIGGQLQVHAC